MLCADNITNYENFEQVIHGATGFTFSINSSGNLIITQG